MQRYSLIILGYKHVVRVAEWSKAPDSSSGPRKRAWVQIPLLTKYYFYIYKKIFGLIIYLIQSKSNHVKLNAYCPTQTIKLNEISTMMLLRLFTSLSLEIID
ncbi:hypothetical protein LINPERHAP2_LOCUS34561 [Linum perenne]